MKEVRKCLICARSEFIFLFPTQDRLLGLEGNFKLYRCRHCGLKFLNPQLSYEELGKYYPSAYMPFRRRADDWRDKFEYAIYRLLNIGGISGWLARPLKHLLRRSLVVKRGTRLLDIGCGSGNFLQIARRFGLECYGTDMYSGSQNVINSPEVKIYNQRAEDISFPGDFFQVVTANHVVEHLIDPRIVLDKVRKILVPDGCFIIHVPNANSLNARLFGRYCQSIDSPRHLNLFSAANFRILCEQSGFKVQKIEYRTPVTVNVIAYSLMYVAEKLLNRAHPSKIIRKIFGNIVLRIILFPYSIILNMLHLGDGMEVFLINKK